MTTAESLLDPPESIPPDSFPDGDEVNAPDRKSWTEQVLLTIFLVFTGVAIMLWAVVPTDSMNVPWLLLVVPVVPLVAGVVCLMRAKAHPDADAFQTVKEQLSADMAMLREVSAAT